MSLPNAEPHAHANIEATSQGKKDDTEKPKRKQSNRRLSITSGRKRSNSNPSPKKSPTKEFPNVSTADKSIAGVTAAATVYNVKDYFLLTPELLTRMGISDLPIDSTENLSSINVEQELASMKNDEFRSRISRI